MSLRFLSIAYYYSSYNIGQCSYLWIQSNEYGDNSSKNECGWFFQCCDRGIAGSNTYPYSYLDTSGNAAADSDSDAASGGRESGSIRNTNSVACRLSGLFWGQWKLSNAKCYSCFWKRFTINSSSSASNSECNCHCELSSAFVLDTD